MSDRAIDRDLMFRVKDVGDALNGHLDGTRVAAVITRLIAAADHLGAATVGVELAQQLTTADGLDRMLRLFGQGERVLDTAAITLGAVSVHSAIDLCAGSILAAVDGNIPASGGRESGMPDLRKRARTSPLPGLFQIWLDDTLRGDFYAELERWRDPQTHRPVPTATALGPRDAEGRVTRASVHVLGWAETAGPLVDFGAATETLPRFREFGEERFLALKNVLLQTYAPDWRR